MSTDDEKLKPIRARIDAIDKQLLGLLNERAQCAIEVGEIKQASTSNASGADGDATEAPVFYRPEREAQILTALMQQNPGPLPDEEAARLFREIISCCLNLEVPLTVAYFGPEGTYTVAASV